MAPGRGGRRAALRAASPASADPQRFSRVRAAYQAAPPGPYPRPRLRLGPFLFEIAGLFLTRCTGKLAKKYKNITK